MSKYAPPFCSVFVIVPTAGYPGVPFGPLARRAFPQRMRPNNSILTHPTFARQAVEAVSS
jgi:hypothetical protein